MQWVYGLALIYFCLTLISTILTSRKYSEKTDYHRTNAMFAVNNYPVNDDNCWYEYCEFDFQPIRICYRSAQVTNHRSLPSLNDTTQNETETFNALTSTSNPKMTIEQRNSTDYVYKKENNSTNNETGYIHGENRVINGFTIDIKDHPWMVYLEMCLGSKCSRCGGTIIDRNAVLTAAHCVKDAMCNGEIFVGNRIRRDGRSENYDLALIFPSGGEQFTAQPLSLPIDESEQPKKHDEVYVLGWGRVCGTDGECLTQLHSTDALNGVILRVHTKDEKDCNYLDPLFCAGGMDDGLPRDACVGDSGGPLECRDKKGAVYLCGVVSKGPAPPNCGRKPGAYVKIAYNNVLNWLKDSGINMAYQNRTPARWDMQDRFADSASRIKFGVYQTAIIIIYAHLLHG